jgi:hypothetical protein
MTDAYSDKQDKEKSLTPNDWSLVAHWVMSEKERRANDKRRVELDLIWKEIDRQLSMRPLPRQVQSGQKQDWFPDVELPLQFDCLEVNAADVRRLIFPRGSEWYSVSSDLSDDYEKRFKKRRESVPMLGARAVPMKIDQDTANILAKSAIDHYHRVYDFRSKVDLFIIENLKYGTAVARVKEVSLHKFHHDFRGLRTEKQTGPALIPCSIKNTWLDDTPLAVMHEGLSVAPGHIRGGWRKLRDVQNAISIGGPERGWRQAALRKIEAVESNDGRDGCVEYLEYEGDLIVPRTRGDSIFLPNVEVTVAVGKGGPEVIRFKENKFAFSSYIVGTYMRDDLSSPYGTSPLMKGQPLQEAATSCMNDLLGAAAISGRPPGWYDRNDSELAAKGGPDLYPGAMTPTDSPDAIEFMDAPEVAPLINAYAGVLKQYEDMTAVNDPRRGGATKSHTTAYANDMEQTRGLTRTDDFVQGLEYGPLTSMLYMEYEIVKSCMKTPYPIQVDAGGVEGWVNIASGDLADNVAFKVHGSMGVLNERQQAEAFAQATNMALQVAGIAAQFGQPIAMQFMEIVLEGYRRAGINNAAKFVGPTGGGNAGAAPPAPAVPQSPTGLPANDLTDVAALSG